MLRTYGDEVATTYVTQGCRHVAEDGLGVGIHLIGTVSHITTAKDSIMDDDTAVIKCCPLGAVRSIILAFQSVK